LDSEEGKKLKVGKRNYVMRSLTSNAMPPEAMNLTFLREALMEAGGLEMERNEKVRVLVKSFSSTLKNEH
jgi:hypothetical protein